MVLTKGTSWQSHLEFLKSRFSSEDIEKVKALVHVDEVTELFGKPILPVSKLPLKTIINFMIAADKALGRGDLSLFKESLRYKANKDLKGVYRIFAMVLTPAAIIQRTAVLWKQLYGQGDASVEKISDTSCRLRITHFPDMPRYHDVSVVAYAEEVIRLTGKKNVQGTILKSISQGDDHCLFQFSWE